MSLLVRQGRGVRTQLVVIGALVCAWAFAPFVLVALDAAAHHRVFLGVAGYYPMDGLQYLGWARDAHDGLIRSLYGATAGKPVLVHPMWSLTGILWRVVPMSPALTMAFWKAVSAAVLFAGCVKAVTRYVPRSRRSVALVLALFGGLTPFAAVLPLLDHWLAGSDFARAAGDLVSAMSLWDYSPLAIALGLMPFVIDRLEHALAGERRAGAVAALLGLLVAWLHPWQGITLIAIGTGLALLAPGEKRRAALTLLPAALAIALPVLYYLLLSRVDAAWATSEHNSIGEAFIPMPVAVACEAPLALLALLAARRGRRDREARALLLWPLATLLTIAISPSGQYRALDGFAIPIMLLAVRAWPARWRVGAVLAVAAALVPLAVFAAGAFAHLRSPDVTAYTELAPSDAQAVRLAARAPGGGALIAPAALGTAIPALTGIPSWVGHPIWTPSYGVRKQQVEALVEGALPVAEVRTLLDRARPRALVEPCGAQGHLRATLASLGYREARVGCALVYRRAR